MNTKFKSVFYKMTFKGCINYLLPDLVKGTVSDVTMMAPTLSSVITGENFVKTQGHQYVLFSYFINANPCKNLRGSIFPGVRFILNDMM